MALAAAAVSGSHEDGPITPTTIRCVRGGGMVRS
jgi:hypothetical protein